MVFPQGARAFQEHPGNPRAAVGLTDGRWHRMHPLTPLLRGGIVLIVALGLVVNNLRDRLIGLIVPGGEGGGAEPGDPVDYVLAHDAVGWALLGVVVFVLLLIGLFTLSWRVHEFRVTGEVVEVRSGVVFRAHRKARLDRVQGISIARPFLPRLFGTARLEVEQAGNDANVRLEYLGSAAADDLRARILQLASGARGETPSGPTAAGHGVFQQRVGDFLTPELDRSAARATRVVTVHQGKLLVSTLLAVRTLIMFAGIAAIVVSIVTTAHPVLFVSLIPAVAGVGGYVIRRFSKSLQYTIAETPDGIRIGYGLVSTTNETLPPGRIHAVSVTQPVLWRPFGWWEVRINRASRGGNNRDGEQRSSVVLPVGNAAEVRAVLEIILPELVGVAVVGADASRSAKRAGSAGAVDAVDDALSTDADAAEFVRSPGRGAWFRPLSWHRNGFRFVPGAVVLRRGAIWRSLVLVPLPRVQSVHVAQGPLGRLLSLASVRVHTVHGPVSARIGALDRDDAMRMWAMTEARAISAARADTSHRWRASRADADHDRTGGYGSENETTRPAREEAEDGPR